MHSQRSGFPGGDDSLLIGELFGTGGSQCHGPGKGGRIRDAEGRAAFKVSRDQERQPGYVLKIVQENGGFVNVTGEQNQSTDMILPYFILNCLEILAAAI